VHGSYLSKIEQPILTKWWHYYEDCLGEAGLEAWPNAPNATERPQSLYPTKPGGNYETSFANSGYYFDPVTWMWGLF
jgi:hypothetical protein